MNNNHLRSAVLLSIATLIPSSASADIIVSNLTLTANTTTKGENAPVAQDSDSESLAAGAPGGVEALSQAAGIPFPNQPNSVGSAFASAAQLALAGDILPGVGVNGFFFRNALFPPNTLEAVATITQTITNTNSPATPVVASIFIPEPTIRFFGVGDFFPDGANIDRDAFGFVEAKLDAKIRDQFGTVRLDTTVLEYGILTFRDPQTGVFSAKFTDGGLELTRFEEADGSFLFRLPELRLENIALPEVPSFSTLEVNYVFTAVASTGFGETGIFAAIGDPFNLSAGGGSFKLQAGGAVTPNPVPEPAIFATLVLGLIMLGNSRRRRKA